MFTFIPMRLFLFPLFLTILGFASCVTAPEYPVEPVIAFEQLNKSQIYQFTNGPLDSVVVQFSFTDGDGDLSSLTGDSVDIFLTDSRTDIQQGLSIPVIPEEGTGNGISGDVFLTIVNDIGICCILGNRFCVVDERLPIDTVSYSIQIVDRAGNLSNAIRTPPIQILCLGQ